MLSVGVHGPSSVVENWLVGELDEIARETATGRVVAAVPVCSWSVNAFDTWSGVNVAGGFVNTAEVGVHVENVLQPLTAVAPSTVAVQPVASHAVVGSPPSVSWIEPASLARTPAI